MSCPQRRSLYNSHMVKRKRNFCSKQWRFISMSRSSSRIFATLLLCDGPDQLPALPSALARLHTLLPSFVHPPGSEYTGVPSDRVGCLLSSLSNRSCPLSRWLHLPVALNRRSPEVGPASPTCQRLCLKSTCLS